MSVREVTYYQVTCDHSGCEESTLTFGEYSAWSDKESAIEDWSGHGGQVISETRHLCLKHRQPECTDCGEVVGLRKDERGCWFCPTCMPGTQEMFHA